MAREVTSPLSVDDEKDLAALELIIDTGIDAFLEVGKALAEIQARKLWRPHKSFAAYLEARWPEMCRSRAYQAIRHARTYEAVSTVVDSSALNERHTRELASFPSHLHKDILERALELAGDGKPLTAPIINRAGLLVMDERNGASDEEDDEAEEETPATSGPGADTLKRAADRSTQPKLHPLLRAAEHHRLGRKDSKKTVPEDMEDPKLRAAAEKLRGDLLLEAEFLHKLLTCTHPSADS